VRVDLEVCAAKFRQEVELLQARADVLRGIGCYVVRAALPEIDAIVIPLQCAAFGVQVESRSRGGIILPNGPAAGPAQWGIVGESPSTRANSFGVRVSLDDFDMRAPSVTFRHPASWDLLLHRHIPQAIHIVDGAGFNLIHDNHPTTKVPFFCMQGVREYHEHPQHTGDDWILYRGTTVLALLTTLTRNINNSVPVYILRDGAHTPKRIEWAMISR
jgi:Predicted metal binding domain